jgi:hypothetical protein
MVGRELSSNHNNLPEIKIPPKIPLITHLANVVSGISVSHPKILPFPKHPNYQARAKV